MARMGRRCGERNVDAHRGYRRAAGRSGQLAGTLLLALWDGRSKSTSSACRPNVTGDSGKHREP